MIHSQPSVSNPVLKILKRHTEMPVTLHSECDGPVVHAESFHLSDAVWAAVKV